MKPRRPFNSDRTTRFLRNLSAGLILLLAVYGLYSLFRGEKGAPGQRLETRALGAVSRGDILNEFRLVTVERQYRIPVLGRSFKPVPGAGEGGVMGQFTRDLLGGRDAIPGTTTNLVYEMVTTVTMGIDLAKLQDSDIANSDTETTLTLPAPEVMTIQHDQANSRIFSQDKPALPYLDNSATLLAELQKTGEAKHRAEAEADEALEARAKNQARDSLQKLLQRIHPGRAIHIEFHEKPGTVSPK